MAKRVKSNDEVEVFDVKDESEVQSEMEDFMAEMGVEAGWNDDFDDGLGIPADYSQIGISEMFDEDIYGGKPFLSDIQVRTFEDKDTGEEVENISCTLVVTDDDEAEAYTIPINLKKADDVQTHVHSASKLYALVMGLMELKQKGISKAYNELTKVSISSLQRMIDSIEYFEFEVKTITGKITYNTFRVKEVKYEE